MQLGMKLKSSGWGMPPKLLYSLDFLMVQWDKWGVRKMHSWAKLSKVWQSWHIFKRGNKEAKLVHIPIHFWIYYAKQSWQSWDINPLFKAKLAKLRYNFSDNGQSLKPKQSWQSWEYVWLILLLFRLGKVGKVEI